MYSVACGHVVGVAHAEPVACCSKYTASNSRRDLGLGACPRSAARAMILSSTSVTLLTKVTSKPRPLEVAADDVEHDRRAAVADVRRRRRPSARTRTSTPCPGSRGTSSTVSRSSVSRIRTHRCRVPSGRQADSDDIAALEQRDGPARRCPRARPIAPMPSPRLGLTDTRRRPWAAATSREVRRPSRRGAARGGAPRPR